MTHGSPTSFLSSSIFHIIKFQRQQWPGALYGFFCLQEIKTNVFSCLQYSMKVHEKAFKQLIQLGNAPEQYSYSEHFVQLVCWLLTIRWFFENLLINKEHMLISLVSYKQWLRKCEKSKVCIYVFFINNNLKLLKLVINDLSKYPAKIAMLWINLWPYPTYPKTCFNCTSISYITEYWSVDWREDEI